MSGVQALGSTSQKQPKTMSSRLANMKFMQRAGSSTPLLVSPAPSNPATDSEIPSSKRQKVSHNQDQDTPAAPATPGYESLRRLGVTGAETMWSLNWRGQHEAGAQQNDVEAADNGDLAPWTLAGSGGGRLIFGSYKKTSQQASKSHLDDENGLEESEDGDSDNSDRSGTDGDGRSAPARKFAEDNAARIKAARAERRRSERDASQQLAKGRRKKDVKLNKTDSSRVHKSRGISTGGGHH